MISNLVLMKSSVMSDFKLGKVAIGVNNKHDLLTLVGYLSSNNEYDDLDDDIISRDYIDSMYEEGREVYVKVKGFDVEVRESVDIGTVDMELVKVSKLIMPTMTKEVFSKGLISIVCRTEVENDLFIGYLNKEYKCKLDNLQGDTSKVMVYSRVNGEVICEEMSDSTISKTISFEEVFNVVYGIIICEEVKKVRNDKLWGKFIRSNAVIRLEGIEDLMYITSLVSNYTNLKVDESKLDMGYREFCYISDSNDSLTFTNDIDTVPISILEFGVTDFYELLQ